ncbi:MAG: orotidine-5'-phosphate decarboxylase [Deltaproteobacteria bacterium]|nr:orotidine-5'-phosphate decarboxylase [Deltaproteobacteria bacterium]
MPEPRLCFALDVPTAGDAVAWIDLLDVDVGVFKIGLELFVAEGPSIVRRARARGAEVFLDLKLHDIPNTVASSVKRAIDLDVRFLTLHASGGQSMLRAAAKAAEGTSTTLLAVTALTSLSDDELLAAGHIGGATALVPQLARLAAESGVGGVVCSPLEIEAVKRVAPRLVVVTPGVRGAHESKGDQTRTKSAEDAIAAGADVVVVGRPIKGSPDPKKAARALALEIARGLGRRNP